MPEYIYNKEKNPDVAGQKRGAQCLTELHELLSIPKLDRHISKLISWARKVTLQVRKLYAPRIQAGHGLPRPGAYHLARAGLIVLHASTRPCTDATDFSNICFSAGSSVTSTIFSTPLAPITTGTPT